MQSKRHSAAVSAAFFLATAIGVAHADIAINDPSTEYLNRIKVGETIQPLGETPFGESVSLYTGGISFRQTDISFPGIGPTIALTRTYEVSGSPLSLSFDLPMGDWDLAAPRISTLVPGSRMGMQGAWNVESAEVAGSPARCSQFGPISEGSFVFGLAWWHGYQLITGDGSSQPLLKRTAENSLVPSGSAADYPALTPAHWVLSCLPTTSNGMPGEGFLATAPDGTRYWFDNLSYGPAVSTLVEQIPWTPHPSLTTTAGTSGTDDSTVAALDGTNDPSVYWGMDEEFMPRRVAHLYASRVEDRFGNWVSYRYVGDQLREVNASDGRKVQVQWRTDAPLIDSITLQPGQADARTWSYQYLNPTDPATRSLVAVVQPDASRWQLSMASGSVVKLGSPQGMNPCGVRTYTSAPEAENFVPIQIVHPSGLVGRFNLSIRGHARSWVPTACVYHDGVENPPSEDLPPVYISLSLTSKIFSGPGVDPITWVYRYSAAAGSTESECLASPCKTTQWVEVTDPSQRTSHYTYSTKWGAFEGKLLSKVDAVSQTGLDTPDGLQTEAFAYADPTAPWAYPSRLGQAMADPLTFTNDEPTERLTPEVLHQLTLQGVTFNRQTQSFDRFGQPETVVRSNSTGTSKSDTTLYWPADGQWVLGQPWKITVGGRLVSQTDYDPHILPQRTYNFGLLVATYGYTASGMLASITDPNGNVTTLSDHKRGIPQTIKFADLSTVAPSVDDFGQISSVRNQLGDSTAYRYDSLGRMSRIDFPAGDTVAWNPVNRNFVQIAVDEYGLPPGHWKQTVDTGNARVTNFYDVMWRPRLTLTEDTSNAESRSFVVHRYDEDGREIFSSYPVAQLSLISQALQGVSTEYDALGRVVAVRQDSEQGVLASTREYLTAFRTRVTNPRQFQTTTSFQIYDTPSEELPRLIEAPEGITTTIDRDLFGKPRSITRSGPGG